jgi:four helix bundle protein
VALASRFEDLRAWQAARRLTGQVYALLRRPECGHDFALADQIRRAAISTMNNLAEGFDSASRAEFARFLRYASRSASEVQSCLHVALDQRYIDRRLFDEAYAQAAMVCKLCSALIRSFGSPPKPRPHTHPQVKEAPAQYRASLPPVTGHRSPVTPLGGAWGEGR